LQEKEKGEKNTTKKNCVLNAQEPGGFLKGFAEKKDFFCYLEINAACQNTRLKKKFTKLESWKEYYKLPSVPRSNEIIIVNYLDTHTHLCIHIWPYAVC
jgi:hypothetical protein